MILVSQIYPNPNPIRSGRHGNLWLKLVKLHPTIQKVCRGPFKLNSIIYSHSSPIVYTKHKNQIRG